MRAYSIGMTVAMSLATIGLMITNGPRIMIAFAIIWSGLAAAISSTYFK